MGNKSNDKSTEVPELTEATDSGDKVEVSAHDEVVKKFLSEKETAVSYFQESLPGEITQHMDFESLKICKDSFVDKALSKTFADILYEIKFGGKKALIYLLIEHKSRKEIFTPLQQLKYMVGAWELYLGQNEKVKKLPVIIPMILYHGESKWELETNFGSLFDSPEYLKRYVPDFEYNLNDISHVPDDEIKGTIRLRVLCLTLKYIFSPHLKNKLPGIFKLMREFKDKTRGTEYIEILLRYLTRSAKKITKEELNEAVFQLVEGGDVMATIAEQWIEEGMERGIKEGIKEGKREGKQEGKKEGKWEIVMNLLKAGLPISTITQASGFSAEEINRMKNNPPQAAASI